MIISHREGGKKKKQMMVRGVQEIEELRVGAVNF